MKCLVAALSLLWLAFPLAAQNAKANDAMKDCPMHSQQQAQAHHAVVESHGDEAMGFAHERTTHHFRLFADGGAIEVTVNDPHDQANTEAIRLHLSHIAGMFGNGDYSTPMFVHDGVPPGVTTMKRLQPKIRYKYEETPSGGRVRILARDAIALAAIHDFLWFQITDHQTGDSLEVPQE